MAERPWDDRWNHYPESRPIATTDGIATSKQRGEMALTWWSKRFVDVLDSYGLGTRMKRGRRYARSGQVLSLEVNPGLIAAQVQGSRRTPYLVSIRSKVPTDTAWAKLDEALTAKVGFVARLLAGEVPPEIEEVCTDASIDLFPASWSALDAVCNCPDWENPCKHLAAVLYVYADHLDANPWLLFTWRGRTRDELLAHLDARCQSAAEHDLPVWWPLVPGMNEPGRVHWQTPDAVPPNPPDAILARLGPLDVLYGDVPIATYLTDAYVALTAPTDSPASTGHAEPTGPAG